MNDQVNLQEFQDLDSGNSDLSTVKHNIKVFGLRFLYTFMIKDLFYSNFVQNFNITEYFHMQNAS